MFRKLALAVTPAILLAAPLMAQDTTTQEDTTATGEVDISAWDTDADGFLSLTEAQAAWPELLEADFTAADSNADGMLDQEELRAAVEAGTLTLPESDI